ncbi:hypothetical protein PspLS_04320, partial [Pyricularia sp. CBS 133598]
RAHILSRRSPKYPRYYVTLQVPIILAHVTIVTIKGHGKVGSQEIGEHILKLVMDGCLFCGGETFPAFVSGAKVRRLRSSRDIPQQP